jgi:hypothetical protein
VNAVKTNVAQVLATETQSVNQWKETLTAVVPGATQTAVIAQATETSEAVETMVYGAIATQTAVVGEAVQTAQQQVVQTVQAAVPSATLTAVAALNPTQQQTAIVQIVETQTAVVGQAEETAVQQVASTETAIVPLATITAVLVQEETLQATETPPNLTAIATAFANAAATAGPAWQQAFIGTFTPTPTPIVVTNPTTQVLWKNGNQANTVWGAPLSVYANDNYYGNFLSVNNITDGSDTWALGMNDPNYDPVAGVEFSLNNGVDANIASYYAAGHFQFDIMLGPAYGSTPGISANYSSINSSGPCGQQFSGSYSLNTSSFTHISIPISAMSNGQGNCGSGGQIKSFQNFWIQVDGSGGYSGTMFYVDNVELTPN